MILYNVPGRTAVNVAPATILELARHPRIVAVKEASGDLIQMMRIVRAPPRMD
ncbi:MAG: dihydrodipicolinate synthase family protein [Gemmatimonadales bacterium]